MKKSIKSLLAVAALAFAGGAFAQQPALSSVYLGATLGQSDFKDGCNGVSDCDSKDTAWRLLGGYRFNQYFSAELGYHDLGEVSGSGASVKGNAWELVGLASYPVVDKFSVYGKLGGYRGELKGNGANETNTDLTYGVGLQYDVLKNVGIRGEWQRYAKLGGGDVQETDVDVLSIGAVYRFQ